MSTRGGIMGGEDGEDQRRRPDAGYSGEVRFDYHQFYIGDAAADPDAQAAALWDDPAALARGVAVGPGVVVMLTEDVGAAWVDVKVRAREPDDQVGGGRSVDVLLSVPSGRLAIDGYPGCDKQRNRFVR